MLNSATVAAAPGSACHSTLASAVDDLAVDCHFHVFKAGVSVGASRYVPDYDAPLSAWQAGARAAGVGGGVVVQTSFMGNDNRELLAVIAQNPTIFRGVAGVDLQSSHDDMRALAQAGVCGVRLNWAGSSHRLPTESMRADWWESMIELGWHLELHTDIGRLPESLAQIPPSIPVVIDHLGKPQSVNANDASVRSVLYRTERTEVWIKLSGAYRQAPEVAAAPLARLWREQLGVAHLVWGSDWPCTNHESHADLPQLRHDLKLWLDDEDDVRRVTTINPRRLYWASPAA